MIKNEDAAARSERARFYHLQISNDRRRWSPAENVQVFLIRIEEPGFDGIFQLVWSGNVPMRWRHQEFYPLTRTIGPETDCDLCYVTEEKWFGLLPLFVPNDLQVRRQNSCRIAASFQARSNQADSPIIRVEIAWDGLWEDGDTEIKRHMKMKVIEGSNVA